MQIRTTLPIAAIAATTLLSMATNASAQEADEVSSTGKGITGGALLGGEAVMLVEAALDVQPTWAYVVGGLAGGIGGGVGGFFIEDSADPKISLYLLAGGMAFAIPTTVAVLSATSYEPPADYTEDRAPADEPVAEPPAATPAPAEEAPPAKEPATEGASAPRRLRRAVKSRKLPPPALLAYDSGNLLLSVPAVEIRDVYSRRELAVFGVEQETEVRVPVLDLAF